MFRGRALCGCWVGRGGQPFHCCFAGDLGGDGVKVWDGKGGRGVMS